MSQGIELIQVNLEATYVKQRRASKRDIESRIAEKSRDGFHRGMVSGLLGMALSGFTRGLFHIPGTHQKTWDRLPKVADYFKGKLTPEEVEQIRKDCSARGVYSNDVLMEKAGWPSIDYDGKLLISHQDA